MIYRFSAVLIAGARIAHAQVSETLTCGEIAGLLRAEGLEIATPLAGGHRLGMAGIMAGDRLAIFADEPRRGDFPAPVRTGGREVTVRVGDSDISTAGHGYLSIGVPALPDTCDIDLRAATADHRVALLPPRCAALLFDGQIGQWFAVLTGGARVLLDDYELTHQPVPITGTHTLRFYLPVDDIGAQPPLAEIRLTAGTPRTADGPRLPSGSQRLTVRYGAERGPYMLRASDNVRVSQVAEGLGRQAAVEITGSGQVMRLRVAAEDVLLRSLLPDEELYIRSR